MNFRTNQKNGDSLSILGYGCMRFTHKGSGIDQEKAETELKAALDAGVNYYDVAYIYPGCEVALGKFIAKYGCRDKMFLATKLPHYLLKKSGDIDRYFNEQLKRLQTDHIDYYLMHMLSDAATWSRLQDMGIEEWIAAKKASGEIRNIGFSFHGGSESFKKVVDVYNWDFCQIQFNYMDEHTQAGIEGLNYANEKGLPVIIMEPLRGGKLANRLPKGALDIIAQKEPLRTPVDWALRWIWDHPQVNVVLSGMNDMEQITENCRLACECLPNQLSPDDLEFYKKVAYEIGRSVKVGCTGCGYCQPCPQGVVIPNCFAIYNESFNGSYIGALKSYAMTTAVRKDNTGAGMCVGCGACEKHCPQGIHIRDELKNVKNRFETPFFKAGVKVVNTIMKF